jgi:hypothetical protein
MAYGAAIPRSRSRSHSVMHLRCASTVKYTSPRSGFRGARNSRFARSNSESSGPSSRSTSRICRRTGATRFDSSRAGSYARHHLSHLRPSDVWVIDALTPAATASLSRQRHQANCREHLRLRPEAIPGPAQERNVSEAVAPICKSVPYIVTEFDGCANEFDEARTVRGVFRAGLFL